VLQPWADSSVKCRLPPLTEANCRKGYTLGEAIMS
jgi:hypothetical protein